MLCSVLFCLLNEDSLLKEWLCFGFCPFLFGNFVLLQTPPNPTSSLWVEGTGQHGEAGERSSSRDLGPGAGALAGLQLQVCTGWVVCIFACSSESGRRKFAYVNIDLHSPSQEDRPTVTETLTK